MKLLKSLRTRIVVFSLLIVVIAFLTTIFSLKEKIDYHLSTSLEKNALSLLQTVKFNVATEYRNIIKNEKILISHHKEELKSKIDFVFSMIDHYQTNINNGSITLKEAQESFINLLANTEFENSTAYFWITDTTWPYPRLIFHKITPELEGTVMDDSIKFNKTIDTGENVFSKMVEICLSEGEGFVEYYAPAFTKQSSSRGERKMSYVRLYKPWNWILGTGINTDDIQEESKREISKAIENLNNTIAKQIIAKSGYCFIFGEDDSMYVHPYMANTSGSDLINPSTSNKIFDDLKASYHSGKNHFEYNWNRVNDQDNYIYKKKAFITYFEPLNWYICVTVYRDDFEYNLKDLSRTIFLLSSLILFLALIISLRVAHSIISPLNAMVDHLKKTDETGLPDKLISKSKTNEISILATTINNMIDSIQTSRQEIKNERDFSMEIINGSPDIICGLKKNGNVSFVNQRAEAITGYKPEELVGKNWWNLLVTENEKELTKIREKVNSTLQQNMEIKLKTKSGDLRVLLWNTLPVYFTGRRNIDILGNCLDITDRKNAEEKLKYLQEYFQNIISAMPSIIIGIDSKGNITQWNDRAKSMFPAIQNKNKSVYDLDIDWNIDRNLITQIISTGKIKKISLQNVLVNDSHYYFEMIIYPLVDKNFNGAVIRIDDITEKVKMEEMMVQSEKMISVGGLAAGMAHEINNPIAGMLQNATVLKNKLSVTKKKNIDIAREISLDMEKLQQYIEMRKINKHLDLIQQSGQRAAEIILNMLSFARKSDSRFTYADISELIEQTLKILATDYNVIKKYDFQKITIKKHYQENLPKIRCETTKLEQVFMNVLKNGAEAMYDNSNEAFTPQFNINVYTKGKDLFVEIENSGPAIPPDIRKRIFEPFFTTKKKGKGTGLGLSVSYFIVTRHHDGAMWVESDENNKTKFVIRLPIKTKTEI